MANPNTPVTASSPVPPPFQNLPFGELRAGGQVYLSVPAIQFLQELWASIQGGGGILEQLLLALYAPGVTGAQTISLINDLASQFALLAPPRNTGEVQALFDQAVLLARQPQVGPLMRSYVQNSPADPTAPASTVNFTMQGLAARINPASSGVIQVTICGIAAALTSGAAGVGILYEIVFGQDPTPVNGAAFVGTAVGAQQEYTIPVLSLAGNVRTPFSIQAIITGLSPGIPYWIDLAAKSLVTASAMGLSSISMSIIEI